MNRYLLDIGLCKNKKNCGRRLFSFSCLRSAKFRYTRMEQSSQMGEIDERVRLFPLAIVSLTPFVELKYGKRNIISGVLSSAGFRTVLMSTDYFKPSPAVSSKLDVHSVILKKEFYWQIKNCGHVLRVTSKVTS